MKVFAGWPTLVCPCVIVYLGTFFKSLFLLLQLSDLTDKMKRSFFQTAVVSILLYGCTTWTLTKRLEKKLDGKYTRMLRAILNKSWRQHPTRHHLPPIAKTIQVRRTRHAGHYWRSRDKLKSDVLLWTPTYGRAQAGRPARTYIKQLCEDTGCSPEDLPEAMNDREKWRERVRDIRASGTTWWWWWHQLFPSCFARLTGLEDGNWNKNENKDNISLLAKISKDSCIVYDVYTNIHGNIINR